MVKVSAILVAAGSGLRMKNSKKKQYLEIGNLPILAYTLLKINRCESIDRIYLVIPKDDTEYILNDIVSRVKLSKKLKLVKGGKTRQESVYNGLCAIKDECDLVVVHDAVRPFVRVKDIENVILTAARDKACILGLPVCDTLKRVDKNLECVTETLPRDDLYQAQTPQVFDFKLLKDAHENAINTNFIGTDDASLVENIGTTVKVLEGRSTNIKITNTADLILARAIVNLEENEK